MPAFLREIRGLFDVILFRKGTHLLIPAGVEIHSAGKWWSGIFHRHALTLYPMEVICVKDVDAMSEWVRWRQGAGHYETAVKNAREIIVDAPVFYR